MAWRFLLTYNLTTAAFEPHGCAEVHNQIVSHIRSTAETRFDNRIVRNYFAAYGQDAAAVRGRLSQPMVEFLEQIDVLVPSQPAGDDIVNIAPHLRIALPSELFLPNGGIDSLGGETHENWIALYRGTIAEHDLYFDMDTNSCAWHQESTPWPYQWYPLERALRIWLSLHETGKFHPSIGEGIYDTTAVTQGTDDDLARSLSAYDSLLAAICERDPELSVGPPGLVSAAVLDRFHVFGLMRSFCLEARRPSFKYIAPGLHIPTSEWFEQVLASDDDSERYQLVRQEGLVPANDEEFDDPVISLADYIGEPLPLFPGPAITEQSENFEWDGGRFVVGDVSGLYSWPDRWFGDGSKLILPYPLGRSGHVEDGNPSWIHEGNRHDVPDELVNNDALLRHGICPFMYDHQPRLSTIFKLFEKLVRSGQWSVGLEGVSDNIDKWREADTAADAEKYRLGACIDE